MVRVELVLDTAHQVQGGAVQLARHEIAFHQADAVLARQGASQFQHQTEHLVQAGIRRLHLRRIIGIHQQVHMDVAVAGMTEIHNRNAVAL